MTRTAVHLDELHTQLQRLTQGLSPLSCIIKTEPQISHLDTCWQAIAAMQATLDRVQHDAICSDCGQGWTSTEVEDATPGEIPQLWERVEPGGVMPLGICPACEGLCLPAWGPAQGQQITVLRECLADLLEWQDQMGGWEAPCWWAAQRLASPG